MSRFIYIIKSLWEIYLIILILINFTMKLQLVGSQWLKERFSLDYHILIHASFIGPAHSIELTSQGNVEEVYRIEG